MDFPKYGNRISADADNGGFVHDLLMECFDRILFGTVANWNVESHFHETDGGVVALEYTKAAKAIVSTEKKVESMASIKFT